MTRIPPSTARGYERPSAVQFSVFLANRVGQLKELLDILAEQDVAVQGLSIVDSTNWAVIRVVCSEPAKARQILKNHSMPFTESDVLLVEMSDRNALSKMCDLLVRAEVSIHFAYPLTIQRDDKPVLVLHVDENTEAAKILLRHGFTLLGDADLAEPV